MPRYQVSRSIGIKASPRQVYDSLADYATWTTWSPWLLAEPGAQVDVSTDSASTGSTYAWKGEVTGEGQLTHRQLVPEKLIDDELQFFKPFKTTCRTSFQIQPDSAGTQLVWNMDASMPWFLFWMIPMMKTFIGMDYRRGLLMIRDLLETGAIHSCCQNHGCQPVGPIRMAGIPGSCNLDEIGPAMAQQVIQAKRELSQLGVDTGEMISVYTKFHIKRGVFDYLVGYLIPESAVIPQQSPLRTWALPSVTAFRVEHVGKYEHLGNPWSVANQIVRYKKLKQSKVGTFEIYRSDPSCTPAAELVTDIYLPLVGVPSAA